MAIRSDCCLGLCHFVVIDPVCNHDDGVGPGVGCLDDWIEGKVRS